MSHVFISNIRRAGRRCILFSPRLAFYWRASHSRTAGHENRTYLPSRTTGSGSLSRCLARSRVFSRTQDSATRSRAASSAGVSKPGEVSGGLSITGSVAFAVIAIFRYLRCKHCKKGFVKPHLVNYLRARICSPNLSSTDRECFLPVLRCRVVYPFSITSPRARI